MRRRGQPAMSIVRRITTWLAVVLAAATTATVVAASPSFAAIVPTDAYATSTVGYAYFNADTQVLSLHDSHADGYGIVAMYYRYDLANPGPYYMWNREGNGTTLYHYFNLPYLTQIKVYACPEDEGVILAYKCGSRAFGYAGGEI
jgi:hypothetical protein